MENITLEQIKKLRLITGRGMFDCKQALQEFSTFEEAIIYLKHKLHILI